MRYYSFDATYLYAVINPSSYSTRWTIYMNDGTRIVQYSNGIQRITDTNGNSVKIYDDENGGHFQDEKTDARGVGFRITYVYDALNRNTSLNYANTTVNPDITRSYDGATNGKGRLWETYAWGNETTGTTVEHMKVVAYDATGRPLDQRQRFQTNSVWSSEYQTQRAYNLSGGVTTQTYPSGQTATYAYDNAGRTTGQEHQIPLDDQISSHVVYLTWHDYDKLNRLTKVHGDKYHSVSNGFTDSWEQTYLYDRFGNRRLDAANTTNGLNEKDFTVNTTNNRLGVPNGQSGVMSYDNAGNLTTDTYTGAGSRIYDAENRMTQAVGGLGGTQYYTYNADGQRTRRKVDGVETWQIYGFEGELLAEYAAANPAVASPQKEYGYRNGQLLVTAAPGTGQRVNFALANGTWPYATASSSFSLSFTPNATNNGDRKGLHWGFGPLTGSGWQDATINTYPDWLQVDFNTSRTIDEIDVFTIQDNWTDPVEPTENMTFTTQGITSFDVQYWNGSSWITVPGGSVAGNNKVWRKFTFPAVTTNMIRVVVNGALNDHSRIVELEAWGTSGGASLELNWLVTDHLGTPRMVFDKTGSLANTKRHDYLAFGEEWFALMGGRTTNEGYRADGVRQKFTRKERDNETGLDYFGAHCYGSTMGSFTSADPLLSSGREEEPQSWNRYSYVLNNPLRLNDPSGLYELGWQVTVIVQ